MIKIIFSMRRKFHALLLMGCLYAGTALAQATLYVAPDGLTSNSGTSITAPTTFANALVNVSAGGTIFMRGGTYSYSTAIVILRGNDGSSGAMKNIVAYNDETPVFDFSAMAENSSNRGIILDALYWHFKGLTIQNAGDNGMLLAGNNNVIESCLFRGNHDTGLQLSRYNTSFNTIAQWPSNNLILNCESYDNHDSGNENADGFAAKLTCGAGNIFRGCISHHNIDDGWDFFTKSATGPIGTVTLENCIAHSNGTLTNGITSGNGDKNGFKLGGENIPVNHTVRRCVAFNNGKHGFTYNSNPGTIEVTNCTAYNNGSRNFNFSEGTSIFKNNLSYLSVSKDQPVGNTSAPNVFTGATSSFTVTAADFVSLTPGPNNNPLGNGFLNLASGSDLIDGGVITAGISFTGASPDLGAIESGGIPVTLFVLTTNIVPTAGGVVTKSPDKSSYNTGDVVTITVTPNSGFTFSDWTGDASGTATSIAVTMNSNKTIAANFIQTPGTFTLTANVSPAGGGTVTKNPEQSVYNPGDVVTLTAAPSSGYSFSGWSGDASGTTSSVSITMNSNKNVTANFTQNPVNYSLTVSASPAGGGSVTKSPNATTYASGTVVTLTAVPASGFNFTAWGGDASGTATTITITMNGNKNITANFSQPGTATTLRIEDSSTTSLGYCGAEGSRQSSYAGADNGFYINISNAPAKGINWKVSVPAVGNYALTWRYANLGAPSNVAAKLLINGAALGSNVPFPRTASWTTWTTTTANVTLSAGVNTIRIESLSGNEFINVDWIEITGDSPVPAACSGSGARLVQSSIEEKSFEGPFHAVAYPNPSRGTATIGFTLTNSSPVSIHIMDVLGKQLVESITNVYPKGYHEVEYKSLKAGMQYFRISTHEGSSVLKLLVE